jgi:hypothetical protein
MRFLDYFRKNCRKTIRHEHEALLELNQIDPLTKAVNQVADQVDTRLEPGMKRLQDATLERH